MIVEGPDGREYGYATDCGERLVELGHANGQDLVYRWRTAGHLHPAAHAGERPVYAIDDVMRVELVTRKAKIRHGGRPRALTT